MFYAWKCKKSKNPQHWVITDKKDISVIPNKVCPQCKSVLEFGKEIPDDARPHIAFDSKQARESIGKIGYYVSNSVISIKESEDVIHNSKERK